MTVTLHLNAEIEAGLLVQAQARGMDLEGYVLRLVEEAARRASFNDRAYPSQEGRMEAVHRMLEFGEKHHLSLGEPVSRALLHEGHRF